MKLSLQQSDNSKKESGFVLIAVLLFLLVTGLLVSYSLESTLVQTRLSRHFVDKMQSFQQAQMQLLNQEKALQQGNFSSPNLYLLKVNSCARYYQITALGNVHGAKSLLRSVYRIALPDPACEDVLTSGRLSWRQEY